MQQITQSSKQQTHDVPLLSARILFYLCAYTVQIAFGAVIAANI